MIVTIEEEVRIPQEDYDILLEKGDRILIREWVNINPQNVRIAKGAYREASKRNPKVIKMLENDIDLFSEDMIDSLNVNEFNILWMVLTNYGFIKEGMSR